MTATDPPEEQRNDELFRAIQNLTDHHVSQGRKVKAKIKRNGDVTIRVSPLGPASLTELIDNGYDADEHGSMAHPEWIVFARLRDDFVQYEAEIAADHQKAVQRWKQESHPGKRAPRAPKVTKELLSAKAGTEPVTITRMMERQHLTNGGGRVWDTRAHPPSSWPEQHPSCPRKPCPFHPRE